MHAEGWNHYFARLEKLAATGDAGPDEWAWAPENLTTLVAAEAALAVLQSVLRNLTEGGPREADAVRRVHCPRAGRAPARLAGPARRHGRRVADRAGQGSAEDKVSVLARARSRPGAA